MRHGSLFSGIGGFDLAAEWMGWENIFHCEWNPFGQKILKHYWPHAKSYSDITKTDFSIHRGGIDILTGGFPCQPYSQAGKRKGKEDDRHLWPEMLRAIREIQPSWIVGENVRGFTDWNRGMVFDEVQADLEAQGYQTTPFLLPACAVNAPHRRDRIWIISRLTTNTSNDGSYWTKEFEEGVNNIGGRLSQHESQSLYGNGDVADTENERLQKWNAKPIRNGTYTAIKRHDGLCGWKDFPTQSPICNGDDGLPFGLVDITFSKWRTESIKALGNSVVPEIAYQIFKAIAAHPCLSQGR